MPVAYVITHIDVKDPVAYEDYKAQAPLSIAQYGGEYLVRGGRMEVLEGAAPAGRTVVLRFPSLERALAWYNSPEYEKPKALRHAVSEGRAIVVEGVE